MADAMGQEEPPKLGETALDRVNALSKAVFGSVPVAGPLLAEIVSMTIPNQRFERVENYLRILAEKIETLNNEIQDRIKADPAAIDLIEEGCFKASRALNEERQQHIASIVFEGLSKESNDLYGAKRLLQIYSDLDDQDIVLLVNYIKIHRTNYEEFSSRHQYLLEPLHATTSSDLATRERAALRSAIQSKLERFGLVRETLSGLTKGVRGIADQMIEAEKDMRITELGRMILHEAALISDEEYSMPTPGTKFGKV